jgi:hypothetical protein
LGNPILGALEERLWQKAYDRYLKDGGSPVKDLEALDRATRDKFKVWVDQWRAEENVKLKPVWKEFKRIIKDEVGVALAEALAASNQAGYAVEKGTLPSFPDAIALPLLLLRRVTEAALPAVLEKKIQFKDMLPETRGALAKYAIDRCFDEQFQRARKEFRRVAVGDRYDKFVVADLIEKDYYHLGERKTASRVDMVILAASKENFSDKDKKNHTAERAAIEAWREFRPHRSDTRRFAGVGWGLEQSELYEMAYQAAG